MTPVEAARKILDTMLGHLGFTTSIEVEETDDGPCLQISTSESESLIGNDGDRLDDLQYLVNRILRKHFPKAPRIKVDCQHYRLMHEARLAEEIRGVAERVKTTGKPFKLRPLNAYYRRLVYNTLMGDPAIESHSPDGDQRFKRITIRPKQPNDTPP